MKNAKLVIAGCAMAALMACSKSGDQSSASAGGSATDIAPANDANLQSNSFNSADIGIGGPLQRESGNYRSQRGGANSDEELAKQIKVALTTGSTGTTGTIPENSLTKINVQVKDGVVTLSGPVSDEKEKQIIQKQAAGFKGVKGVQNNLTVGGRKVQDKPLEPLVPRNPGNQ